MFSLPCIERLSFQPFGETARLRPFWGVTSGILSDGCPFCTANMESSGGGLPSA